MSCIDIWQLFWNRSEGYTKGIVISPRQTGVKMLCVDLTKEGLTTEIDTHSDLYHDLLDNLWRKESNRKYPRGIICWDQSVIPPPSFPFPSSLVHLLWPTFVVGMKSVVP